MLSAPVPVPVPGGGKWQVGGCHWQPRPQSTPLPTPHFFPGERVTSSNTASGRLRTGSAAGGWGQDGHFGRRPPLICPTAPAWTRRSAPSFTLLSSAPARHLPGDSPHQHLHPLGCGLFLYLGEEAARWEERPCNTEPACCRTGAQPLASTHLITADVEPPGARVQLHDLADHGSHQCQGLGLVGAQGVGEKRHFPEVSKSVMLQHKLRREGRRQLSDAGQKLAPEPPPLLAAAWLEPAGLGFSMSASCACSGSPGGHWEL